MISTCKECGFDPKTVEFGLNTCACDKCLERKHAAEMYVDEVGA